MYDRRELSLFTVGQSTSAVYLKALGNDWSGTKAELNDVMAIFQA